MEKSNLVLTNNCYRIICWGVRARILSWDEILKNTAALQPQCFLFLLPAPHKLSWLSSCDDELVGVFLW